ncbi:MAG: FAD-dependent oxidoreductase [Flavobacteriaceae bacterium]
MKATVYILLLFIQFLTVSSSKAINKDIAYDIIIYGATSSGIAAAIQADRLGKSVLLIEPSDRIGGLTTGGLGQTDIGNKQVIGGIPREFYQNIRTYYDDESNWKWQKKSSYKDDGQSRTSKNEGTMWTFEPSAALKVFQKMIVDTKINMVYNERLNMTSGVLKNRNRITAIVMESGKQYKGKIFIDATYEGDLMALSGVSYTVGRESNSQYAENLNGVETALAKHHQFSNGVDPYLRRGDPNSGLLPNISTIN